MTGACHAPVGSRQGKTLADTNSAASPVPIEKSADFEMAGQREFVKSSLPVGGRIEAIEVAERLTVTPDFEDVGATYKPKKDGRGFRRSRIPPRRAQCSFDGSAVKSAFSLLLTKVTKPAAAAAKGISIKLSLNRR